MYNVLTIDLDWLQSHFHLKKLLPNTTNALENNKKGHQPRRTPAWLGPAGHPKNSKHETNQIVI